MRWITQRHVLWSFQLKNVNMSEDVFLIFQPVFHPADRLVLTLSLSFNKWVICVTDRRSLLPPAGHHQAVNCTASLHTNWFADKLTVKVSSVWSSGRTREQCVWCVFDRRQQRWSLMCRWARQPPAPPPTPPCQQQLPAPLLQRYCLQPHRNNTEALLLSVSLSKTFGFWTADVVKDEHTSVNFF